MDEEIMDDKEEQSEESGAVRVGQQKMVTRKRKRKGKRGREEERKRGREEERKRGRESTREIDEKRYR